MSTDRINGFAVGIASFGPVRLLPCRRRLLQAGEPAHLGTPERARGLAGDVVQARKTLIAELEQQCRVAAAAA